VVVRLVRPDRLRANRSGADRAIDSAADARRRTTAPTPHSTT
jgi:hypothetical protein